MAMTATATSTARITWRFTAETPFICPGLWQSRARRSIAAGPHSRVGKVKKRGLEPIRPLEIVDRIARPGLAFRTRLGGRARAGCQWPLNESQPRDGGAAEP